MLESYPAPECRRRVIGQTACVTAGSGAPIVFVHGVGMDASIWAPQIADFAATHQVTAYDLLGHGGSALPPEAPALGDYSDQLLALCDGLELGAVCVVGHSMGALVALEFALSHPERVTRLVALNGVYRRSAEQRAAVMRRAATLEGTGGHDGTASTIARWFGDPLPASLVAPAARVRALLSAVDPVGYARTYRLFAGADTAHAERLSGLAVPALFMTGENDLNSSPAMSRAMAAEAPFGIAEVLPGQRHMMSFVAPEVVNPRLRRFIEDSAGTPSGHVQAGG